MKIKANIFRTKYSSGARVYHAYLMLATKKRKLVISTSTPDSIPGNDIIYLLPIPVIAISKIPRDYCTNGIKLLSLSLRWFKWEWVILTVSTESLMESKYSKYSYSTRCEDEYPETPEESIAQEEFTSASM